MKNFLIAFLVFLVWSFFGLWLYSWLQPISDQTKDQTELAENSVDKDSIDDELEIPIIDGDTTSEVEAIKDSIVISENEEEEEDEIRDDIEIPEGLMATNEAGDIVFLLPEGMSILQNSPDVTIPESIKDFKYKLNTFMIENLDQELHILSRYSALENIETPNLGIQRGNKIKDILVNAGIEADRIVVKPMIKNLDFNARGRHANSISFAFKKLDTSRIEALKNAVPEDITMYPKFSNKGILVNKALQELLAEIKAARITNQDIQVEIIGHTDNVGNANDNYLLGLKFARQVRWYLVTKGGIDRGSIKATSRGESEAIASNKTNRGRTLNRRIEVKFK